MQSTLTLTDGTSPDTFTYRQTDSSGGHTWTAPSPQGDLAGILLAERRTAKTRANIVSRSFKLTYPIYNSGTAKYEGTIQGRVVLNAPTAAPLDLVNEVLAKLVNAFAASNSSQVSDFVNGY